MTGQSINLQPGRIEIVGDHRPHALMDRVDSGLVNACNSSLNLVVSNFRVGGCTFGRRQTHATRIKVSGRNYLIIAKLWGIAG